MVEREDTAGEHVGELPWSEPEIINDLVLDGVSFTRNSSGGLRVVGWQTISNPDGAATERRIVVRYTLPARVIVAAFAAFMAMWPNFSARHAGHAARH